MGYQIFRNPTHDDLASLKRGDRIKLNGNRLVMTVVGTEGKTVVVVEPQGYRNVIMAVDHDRVIYSMMSLSESLWENWGENGAEQVRIYIEKNDIRHGFPWTTVRLLMVKRAPEAPK